MRAKVIAVNTNKPTYFVTADTAESFFAKGEKGFDNLPKDVKSSHNYGYDSKGNVSDPKWYGGSTVEALKFENITSFGDPDTLREFKENFNQLSETIDTAGAFKARKLIATRDKSGIFDFGLASKGLMRKIEYVSHKLRREIIEGGEENPFENYGVLPGVVPADFVIKVHPDKDDSSFIWKRDNGDAYLLRRQQSGLEAAFTDNPNLPTHLVAGGLLTAVKPNKFLKFSSNYDKCYLKFTTAEKNDRTVDLFVSIGGHSGLTSREFAYMVMPGLVVAKILMDSGIKVRINGVFMLNSMNRNNRLASSYVIKDYHESFDWNKMLINAADLRTIRHNVFRGIAGNIISKYPRQLNGKEWTGDDGVYNGQPLNKGRDDFKELSEQLKSFLLEEQKKGNNKTKTTEREKMLFSQIGRIGTDMTKDELFEKSRKEIKKLLLEIDLAFNPAEAVVKRTVDKLKEEGESDWEIQDFLKETIVYSAKLPTKNDYKATQKEQEKATNDYNMRMAAVEKRFK